MGEFPSGQRGQTVNLLAMPSMVRIHLPPPIPNTKVFGIFVYSENNQRISNVESIETERLILPDPYFDPLYSGFRQSNLTT